MIEYAAKRDPNRCPTHPGAVLREDMIPAVRKPKAEIARLLGISRQHLHGILEEKKPLTPEVAVRVSALFGGSTESWLRMQVAFDAWHAERTVDTSKIKRLDEARR